MARRGDMVAVRKVSSYTGATGEDSGEYATYRVMVVTSITRAGEVKAVRCAATPSGRPEPIARMGRVEFVNLGPADVDEIWYALARRRDASGYLPAYDSARELLADVQGTLPPSALAGIRPWVDAERAAEIAARTCDHRPEQNGCERLYCQGVPPAELAMDTDRATVAESATDPAEPGNITYGRALAAASRDLLGDATMPEVGATTHFRDRRARNAQRWQWQAAGHTIRVVAYGNDHSQAVYVDGERIAAGVNPAGYADAHAAQIVWIVAQWLRDRGWSRTVDTKPPADTSCGSGESPHAAPAEAEAEPPTAEPSPMAVTVDRGKLVDALAYVGGAVPPRPSVEVLGGVRLQASPDGTLHIAGFSYEQTRTVTLSAEVAGAGTVLLPWRTVRDFVTAVPRTVVTVSLTASGTAVTVAAGGTRVTAVTLPIEDYPALPDLPPVAGTVGVGDFASAVSRVAVACGRDDTLPTFTGIHLRSDTAGSRLHLEATDRYRLALDHVEWAPVDAAGSVVALVPGQELARAVKAIAKAAGKAGGDVAIGVAGGPDGHIGLRCGGYTLDLRLRGGDFPPVRALLPATVATVARVDGPALAGAVKRVAAAACGKDLPVRLRFDTPDTVTVAVGGGDEPSAAESVPCRWNGSTGRVIAFNPTYLVDGLTRVGPGEVTLTAAAAGGRAKPWLLERQDWTYSYLIQPIRMATPEPAGSAQDTPAGSAQDVRELIAEPAAGSTESEPSPEDPETVAQRAWEAFQAGRHAEALDVIDHGQAVYPDHRVAGALTWDRVRAEVVKARDAATGGSDAGQEPPACVAGGGHPASVADASGGGELDPATVPPVPVGAVTEPRQPVDDAPPKPAGTPAGAPGESRPAEPLVFTLAPFGESGVSYRAARSVVRQALKAVDVQATVVKDPTSRRVFTVDCGQGDRARAAAAVAAAVQLDTAGVPATVG